MFRFFDPISKPLLDAAGASVVIEVGSEDGPGTERLADWCQENDAALHVIDPVPKYDLDEWVARWPGVINFHVDLSLNALPDLPPADVVMIDGDHNWYTVFHELQILAATADEHGRPFPLTLLHDVGWPYGRRDMYYDPESVPEEFRQPHLQRGILLGQSELDDQGFNAALHNARQEGTPRNGVLTAVEDFVESREGRLDLHVLTGLNGLGIIVDTNADEAIRDAVAEVTGASGLRRLLTVVENDRNKRFTELYRVRRARKKQVGELRERLREKDNQVDRLRRQLEEVERRHARLMNRRSVRASLKAASLTRPIFERYRASRKA